MVKTINNTEWFCCPVCGQKMFKIAPGAFAKGILMLCRKCKNEIDVSI